MKQVGGSNCYFSAADSEHSNQSSEPENTTTSADKILIDTKERNDNRANPNRLLCNVYFDDCWLLAY